MVPSEWLPLDCKSLNILQWCREHGCPWDAETCTHMAAGRRHWDVVHWCIENGLYMGREWSSENSLPMGEDMYVQYFEFLQTLY